MNSNESTANTQSILKEHDFSLAAVIKMIDDNKRIRFEINNDFSKQEAASSFGWVYLWIKVNDAENFDICYVGKAGKTIRNRLTQHEGGFNGGSKKGLKNAQMIRDFLENNKDGKIQVFARKSADNVVLGEDRVSMCEAEERAIIQKCRNQKFQLWNAPNI